MLKKSNRNQADLRRLAPLAWWLIPLGLILAVFALTVRADTSVGGPIVSNTTWTEANSPYIVVESIDVWEGVTLTIEPGVVVRFAKEKKLQVSGELIAQGTAGSPIRFTSNEAEPAPGDWGNIEFTSSAITTTMNINGDYVSGSILQFVVVEYGGANTDRAIDAHSLLVDHSTVQSNTACGIYNVGTADAPARITSNLISSNTDCPGGGGIHGEYATVSYNTVVGNSAMDWPRYGGGIYALYSTVSDNTVSNNAASKGGGLYTRWVTVSNNSLVGNSATLQGGGIYADNSVVISNTVEANRAGRQGGGIAVIGGTETSLITHNIVIENMATGEYVDVHGGGIYINGPCTVSDNVVRGNAAIAATQWYDASGGGIYVNYVPNHLVNRNVVVQNVAFGDGGSQGGGIYAYNGDLRENIVSGNVATEGGGIYSYYTTVLTNTVTSNFGRIGGQGAGIYHDSDKDLLGNTVIGNSGPAGEIFGGLAIDGTPQLHYSNIYENGPYDVVILSSEDISGTHNFWGTATSVAILEHVYDWYDDSNRGKLLYIPYLQEPDPDAPVPTPLNLTGLSQNGTLALDWDPIPSTTTGYGYKVYYDADEPGPPYEGTGLDQGDSPIDVGDLTEYTLTGFDPNATYYAAVTAYDNLGREGWYSTVINSLRRLYLPLILK